MKARAAEPAHLSEQIRRFKVAAKLLFGALEYFDMFDSAACPISEPPVIKAMTDAELKDLITMEVTLTVIFPKFPCQTQALERHEAGERGRKSSLWTEIARWLHPCMRRFSAADANVRV